MIEADDPSDRPIVTRRLVLEPILPEHASLLFEALQDERLYQFHAAMSAPSVAALSQRFSLLAKRRSPDGSQIWLNWAVRRTPGEYVGLIQATLTGDHAVIGYDIFPAYWRKGYGKEACAAMVETVAHDFGVDRFSAIVDVENVASIALLESIGFTQAWTGPSEDMPGRNDNRYERTLH